MGSQPKMYPRIKVYEYINYVTWCGVKGFAPPTIDHFISTTSDDDDNKSDQPSFYNDLIAFDSSLLSLPTQPSEQRDDDSSVDLAVKPVKPSKFIIPLDANLKSAYRILQSLRKDSKARDFLDPVDVKRYTDYLSIVKRPIDLNTIASQFYNGEYMKLPAEQRLSMFENEVLIVFQNAMAYNQNEQHPVHVKAVACREIFIKSMSTFDKIKTTKEESKNQNKHEKKVAAPKPKKRISKEELKEIKRLKREEKKAATALRQQQTKDALKAAKKAAREEKKKQANNNAIMTKKYQQSVTKGEREKLLSLYKGLNKCLKLKAKEELHEAIATLVRASSGSGVIPEDGNNNNLTIELDTMDVVCFHKIRELILNHEKIEYVLKKRQEKALNGESDDDDDDDVVDDEDDATKTANVTDDDDDDDDDEAVASAPQQPTPQIDVNAWTTIQPSLTTTPTKTTTENQSLFHSIQQEKKDRDAKLLKHNQQQMLLNVQRQQQMAIELKKREDLEKVAAPATPPPRQQPPPSPPNYQQLAMDAEAEIFASK